MFQNVKKYLSKSHSPRQQPLLGQQKKPNLDEKRKEKKKKKKKNCCEKKKKKEKSEPGHIYEVAQCVAAELCLETRSIRRGTAANGGARAGHASPMSRDPGGVFDRKQQNLIINSGASGDFSVAVIVTWNAGRN
ncbi:hypothetical protein CEXT_735191 [Caerostris extrusa]|uniref:Uncharacterized protein n=1 Tax=Caerostris extrusa TaxID=172846 RepID=A0AAV4UUA0_CAEEX|nr:hypothetical protein CEXT_735191 [Caerostris extrusa]